MRSGSFFHRLFDFPEHELPGHRGMPRVVGPTPANSERLNRGERTTTRRLGSAHCVVEARNHCKRLVVGIRRSLSGHSGGFGGGALRRTTGSVSGPRTFENLPRPGVL
jgi:hypothetical protein